MFEVFLYHLKGTKLSGIFLLILFPCLFLSYSDSISISRNASEQKLNGQWPVLTQYDQDHLRKIAIPLGGIGTGTVSLGGRGDLRDWEIVNRPAIGFRPKLSLFTLYAKPEVGKSVSKALEGQIPPEDYEGSFGVKDLNHGFPRFRNASFAAAYPFGQVLLSDNDVPLDVRIEAFNPLIPGEPDASGLSVAVLRFVLTNKTGQNVSASVCGNIENFIGTDGTGGKPNKNFNQFRSENSLQGLFLQSNGVDKMAEQWGTIALTTTAITGVTYRTSWQKSPGWNAELTDFWDDFSADGKLENREPSGQDNPMGSLAVSVDVPPMGTKEVTFFLTWHFPNRKTWTPVKEEKRSEQNAEDKYCEESPDGKKSCDPNRIGNYYTTLYKDAWDVAIYISEELPGLEQETIAFVSNFCDADLPQVIKEAALYNLSTLRSQTTFRTGDGRFYGFEGSGDNGGCCHGSCTHVWNYEQATAFLFGELACKMRDVEFMYATNDQGFMHFRVTLPLEREQIWSLAAADGQMGCSMKLYRDWQLSGDEKMLRKLWPKARKSIEFCWLPGGWDADQDGVMEGAQHNTMDVEYYGPNPQMGIWYLGALRATEEMARYLGEKDFADKCHKLFENGSKWIDKNLFNGEYYIHQIRPVSDPSAILPGLIIKAEWAGIRDPSKPRFQLGEACLVDQLVGQYMAHVCGLGYLVNRDHIQTTLQSIMKYNFKENLSGHFNNMRSFTLNNEGGILMASYPRGNRPTEPFPYYTEVMTGFEYAANVHMLYEGQIENGLKSIKAIRDRYDGKKRSPFNEAECGSHYVRAMASWAAVLALTGFQYSAVENTIQFAAADKPLKWFWSNGYAWGIVKQKPGKKKTEVELTVLHGNLNIKKLIIKDFGFFELDEIITLTKDNSAEFTILK